jgi:hypothetical protein
MHKMICRASVTAADKPARDKLRVRVERNPCLKNCYAAEHGNEGSIPFTRSNVQIEAMIPMVFLIFKKRKVRITAFSFTAFDL